MKNKVKLIIGCGAVFLFILITTSMIIPWLVSTNELPLWILLVLFILFMFGTPALVTIVIDKMIKKETIEEGKNGN